ncbi:hypothetical protein [Clostridium formicaceticum]|uniref:Spermidine/putrescine ABC transporter membrane protein n=1 Tax=Clostridium formicaceticum TaxID=1497 RepID=A0AAC9WI42_9CLOT|nr:hypothetical protein [Clostridium formicaceticum]AOY77829.1 hypothetical protein BJL90_19365 [Clostridium formicaceticum]ARE88440.1 spermidine/putrescine ABC transporter membrane protein [Clostridium formicaceticum]
MTFKKIIPYLLILPILLLYGVFIGGGLFSIIIESLGHVPILGLQGFNINSYTSVFSQKKLIESLLYSTYISLTASLITSVLGVAIAYFFVTCQGEYIQKLVKKTLQLGLIIPYLYVVFIAMLLLNQTGFYARILYSMGMITAPHSFPELIFDRRAIGIIWVFVFKGTPFVALFVINILSRISNIYKDVGRTLGSRNITLLRRIYIPLCANTIVWTGCIIFAYALGSFEVNYLLSSISPIPISARLYSMFINPDLALIPQTMALNVILFFFGGCMVGIYGFGLKHFLRRISR